MEDYEASEKVATAAEAWKQPFPMELDKIPGFWVVSGFLDSGVVLRLRIVYEYDEDDTELFCEVRAGSQDSFELLGKATSHVWEIALENPRSLFEDEGSPHTWKEEFREMARRWAVTCYILEYGGTRVVRYPFEPESSRDATFTGETYSLIPDPEVERLQDGADGSVLL